MANRGVIYLAFGDSYREEARVSIASLKAVSPDLPVAVVTGKTWAVDPVPDQFVIREPMVGYACKPAYIYEASPFDCTLYLDTDTLVMRDIQAVFELLDHYDVGVRFGGPALREPGLQFHTQCNSGVVLFRRNPVVEEMFGQWQRLYQDAADRRPTSSTKGLNDQRYLAIAIARSKVRPVHLASYLNFALFETITTYSPPIVYHGRMPGMRMLHREISSKWDPNRDWHVRLWLPNIRGLLPAGVRRSDPLLALALLLRRFCNDFRRIFTRKPELR